MLPPRATLQWCKMKPPFDARAKAKILIIGCGSIGERHLRCFQQTGRAEVTGCDAHPELLQQMQARYGVAVSARWEAAVASGGFDAVAICTPPPLPLSLALQALNPGL